MTINLIDTALDLTNGYVYIWFNLRNDHYYIGSSNGNHKSYKAGGTHIRIAFKEFGMNNFIRIILYTGPNYKQIEERILTDYDAAHDPMSYNRTNRHRSAPPGRIPHNKGQVGQIIPWNKGLKGCYNAATLSSMINAKVDYVPWNKGVTGYKLEIKNKRTAPPWNKGVTGTKNKNYPKNRKPKIKG